MLDVHESKASKFKLCSLVTSQKSLPQNVIISNLQAHVYHSDCFLN